MMVATVKVRTEQIFEECNPRGVRKGAEGLPRRRVMLPESSDHQIVDARRPSSSIQRGRGLRSGPTVDRMWAHLSWMDGTRGKRRFGRQVACREPGTLRGSPPRGRGDFPVGTRSPRRTRQGLCMAGGERTDHRQHAFDRTDLARAERPSFSASRCRSCSKVWMSRASP